MVLLDYKSRLPIYEQLYHGIIRLAALGAMGAGDPLPSVRALAQELGVNPNTVQKAYQLLERDGVIGPYSRHEVYVLNTQHFMELVEMEI